MTREKKVVWTYRDDKNHGIHELQILDTNGKLWRWGDEIGGAGVDDVRETKTRGSSPRFFGLMLDSANSNQSFR